MIDLVDARFLRRLALALGSALVVVLGATHFVATPWLVAGPSMEPTLHDGDRVLVDLWTYGRRAPREGEVALLDAPWGEPIVKRVARTHGRGASNEIADSFPTDTTVDFYVLGDNPSESADSRSFGTVSREQFRGRVLWRYWPLSRAGWIR